MVSREKISVTLDPNQVREISDLVGNEYASRSEAVRNLIDKGLRYDDLETERDRLQRQLTATNVRQDDVTELVEYIEEEREMGRYRERRQRKIDQANILTRTKWKLTGVPVEKDK